MTTKDFVEKLKQDLQGLLQKLKPNDTLRPDCPLQLDIKVLLKMALKNEMEATLVAGKWISNTPEPSCRLAFARQAGDEAKHYQLIAKRLTALGVDLSSFDPLQPGLSPLTQHLLNLETTLEKAAAGPFAREAIAVVKNNQFLELLREQGDEETARLYEETIQKDEAYHHQLGENLLLELIQTEEDQKKVQAAVEKTLALAEELTRLMATQKGVLKGPGC